MRIQLSKKPRTIDLGYGVTVEVKPGGSAVVLAAGTEMATASEQGRLAFAKAVGRAAILSWQGVFDEGGAPLDLSSDAINALLDEWQIFLAFEREYVNPTLLVVTEGNA